MNAGAGLQVNNKITATILALGIVADFLFSAIAGRVDGYKDITANK